SLAGSDGLEEVAASLSMYARSRASSATPLFWISSRSSSAVAGAGIRRTSPRAGPDPNGGTEETGWFKYRVWPHPREANRPRAAGRTGSGAGVLCRNPGDLGERGASAPEDRRRARWRRPHSGG